MVGEDGESLLRSWKITVEEVEAYSYDARQEGELRRECLVFCKSQNEIRV